MKTVRLVCLSILSGAMLLSSSSGAQNDRAQYQKLQAQGNFKEAYDGFRKLAMDPTDDPRQVADDMNRAVQCLQRLNRVAEIDAFLEAVIETHRDNWRLLHAAAQSYMSVEHYGYMIAGEFQRGRHRGGGKVVNAAERDRVRALQLMNKALPLVTQENTPGDVSQFFLSFANMLLNNRHYSEAWRLQYLTDLSELPDYDPGWGYYRQTTGAPVDAEGNPVYHHVPKSFEAAKTDGERWRWCLEQAVEFSPEMRDKVRLQLADFLHNQFGVQTMAYLGWQFGRMQTDDSQDNQSGTYALHTLGENETIARLATGVKRFTLPDEFNFIKIYKEVGGFGKDIVGVSKRPRTDEAALKLAQLFENRRQYPKAADYWRTFYKDRDTHPDRVDRIVGNWGRFEPTAAQPAGTGASLEFRFRNGHSAQFTAKEIRVEKLLDDVKAYLKSNPGRLDHNKVNIANIGYRLIHQNQKQYVGEEVARWKMVMNPRRDHFDKRITVTTPMQKPGAYLLTAKMQDGNTSHVVVWINDTAIVKKPLSGKTYYFVADAVTGQPIAGADVDFFGYRQEYQRTPRKYKVLTKQFTAKADDSGQLMPDPSDQPTNHQWIITARTKEGRFAYLGFTGVWYGQRHDAEYNRTKVFSITDRPVYRPDQTVDYKFWVRHAKYDKENTSDFAGKTFTIKLHNPKGEEILKKSLTADAYGGLEDKWNIPADATLGMYRLSVLEGKRTLGSGSFRVEEYKKPEYEVTVDAPTEPVMLGEKIEATIKAKYYFGSPVTNAKVKYKVTRTAHEEPWYPVGPWDWFYGPGYWWFAYDYNWYPGWRAWGCSRPAPFWWPHRSSPPEVVAEQEVEIGEDGTVKVTIDTGVAKAIHPDQDHRYSITAEVVDQSRRTIVGSGEVLVARRPFKVYAWVDRGYYRVGDTIASHFSARTLDGKPVEGKGTLRLLKIGYENGKPVETPVQTWSLDTGAEGKATQQITASRSGQYRLSYELTDAKNHTIEGGYLFTIAGEGFDGSQFRFNHVELVPEKPDYAPGDTLRLQINTDRVGSTVLLFTRPTNGIYLPPKVIRLKGKSTIEEIGIVQRDMPNFFVEAVTISDGRVHSETKEIVVPPEKRVLTVDIEPSSETYKPGEKAKVNVRLTDFFGKPFVGSTVVAIYDKSVEYISGGSNVGDIKEFFWKWRRSHHPRTENNLSRHTGNIAPKNAKTMHDLGVFGATVADDMETLKLNGDVQEATRMVAKSEAAFGAPMARGGLAMGGMGAANAVPMDGNAAVELSDIGLEHASRNDLMATLGPGSMDGRGSPAAMVQPTIRKNFADTALWVGALTTDENGKAQVELDMPENLTTWRIKVWGMGHGTKVGEGATDVVTRKDLIIRLQAPRFFVQNDEVVLSAVVHNYLKSKKSVQVALELDGDTLEPTDDLARTVEIDSSGEARVDWRVRVLDEGEAVVRMKALTDEDSDAMEMTFPCYIHGMLKMDAYSGSLRPKETAGKFTVEVPEERRAEQSRLEVRYSPTLAGAMVDALPYLVNYPYGCTEQTLNRFLPTVITQKVLIDMGLDLEEIRKKRTNLNVQEIGNDRQRAKQWKRYEKRNPVFDQAEVTKMVKEGVKRLTEMQLGDGGWGWFSGWGEHSSAHTTAYVVHGLQTARANDVAVEADVLDRGVAWLKRYQDEQVRKLNNALVKPKPKRPYKSHADNLDAFVYTVLADADIKNQQMCDFLYRDRTKLAVYSLAMFGIALEKQADREKLDMVMRNISQYLVTDDENQTAWLNLPGGHWWYWYGSEYEAHAYYLKLLAKTDPDGAVAPRLVKYLLNNRKHATYWNSTRDTAICVEAMADFLRASGEDKPDMTVEVWLDGKLQQAVEITPKNLFRFDNKFVLEGEAVTPGKHEIELRKKGTGPLYYNGYMTNFTLEDFITKAGLEIKVQRKYYKLVAVDKTIHAAGSRGQVVDQKVEKYERQPLSNLSKLTSGDLVEIELEIDSKNDYEYLIFEDMKPSGFEPVDLRSGYNGNDLGAYMEFRDNRVVFFVDRLARGKHSVSYRMRAETPGRFSALPTRARAMYAPELKANSDEIKLRVED